MGVKMKNGLKSPPNDTVDHFPFTSLGSSNYQPEDHCQTPHFNNASTTSDTLGSADPRINQFRRPRAYGNLYNSLVAREGILTSYTQEKISKKHGVGSGCQWKCKDEFEKKQDESSYTDAIPRSISLNTLFLLKKTVLGSTIFGDIGLVWVYQLWSHCKNARSRETTLLSE